MPPARRHHVLLRTLTKCLPSTIESWTSPSHKAGRKEFFHTFRTPCGRYRIALCEHHVPPCAKARKIPSNNRTWIADVVPLQPRGLSGTWSVNENPPGKTISQIGRSARILLSLSFAQRSAHVCASVHEDSEHYCTHRLNHIEYIFSRSPRLAFPQGSTSRKGELGSYISSHVKSSEHA